MRRFSLQPAALPVFLRIPALFLREKNSMRQVRLFRPSVGEEELENIRDVFERAWLGLGPKLAAFEEEWSRYIGAPASIGVNSGTAALHLALAAFGFAPGAKVLVPALTFVASATAALYNRLEPVFVDVDPHTLSMDLADLERKITPDCVAVVAVHFGGYPVAMDQLMALAAAHKLKVVEDCAHAVGGSYQGRKLGTWGDIGCFSFEEKKGMTTGDGGMISSHDAELIAPLKVQRWVGIDKDTWQRAGTYTGDNDARHWYYEVAVLGYKYNMNDLSAAIGLAQLRKLDRFNARRTALVARYLEALAGIGHLEPLLPYRTDGLDAYWLMGIRSGQRDALIRHLKRNGVATGVHYMPLTLHPLFAAHAGSAPVAERIWHSFLTLPLHVDLSDDDVDYVAAMLARFEPAVG